MSERLAAAAEDLSALYDRMTTEYKEELRGYEEENDRKQRLLDRLLNPRVLLHRVAPCPGLNHDFTETPPIKAEPEEESSAKEQLPEPVPESSAVCVKREPSSPLQNSQYEQRQETQVKARGYKEENDRKQRLLDRLLNPRVLLHRVAPCPGLDHDFTETPPIKAEPEEESGAKEQLPEPVPESNAVCVKREPSSPLQNRQFDQRQEMQVKDVSAETHLQSEGLAEQSDDTDDDEDWRCPLSSSDTETEAEAEGDPYNKVQVRTRINKPSSKNKSAAETSATVHKRDKTRAVRGETIYLQRSVCAKTFNTKRCLEKHTRVHTGEKPFGCSVCKKAFSRKDHLKTHRRTHTGETPFGCSVCKKAFSRKDHLETHRRTHTGEKPFRCSVCKKTFSLKHHLESHRRTHTGDKPYCCETCQKYFADATTLKNHTRIHTGQKPYSCTVCDKAFSHRSALKNHRGTHTGQKPYSCTVCDKTFTRLSTVKIHTRTHTGQRPYSCTVCDKAFSHLFTLKVHTRTHTGQKP